MTSAVASTSLIDFVPNGLPSYGHVMTFNGIGGVTNRALKTTDLSDVTYYYPVTDPKMLFAFNMGTTTWDATHIDSSYISDFVITSPVDKQVLIRNGGTSRFVNRQLILDDISNVTITSLSANQYFGWTGSLWSNRTIRLAHLSSDVILTSPVQNQTLVFDNASQTFQNGFVPFSSLSGVVLTSPTLNQVLTFDGTNWINQAGGGAHL
jgi:hypothetical protein